MTATSSKSPMSGTTTSMRPAAADAAARTGVAMVASGAGAAAAAGTAAGVGVGVGAAVGAALLTVAAASIISNTEPSLTLSPTPTFISLITPAAVDGISIDALSLSTVTSDCSILIVSPGLTSTSMISTSLKSPMSGTLTSTAAILFSSPSLRR